MDLDQPATMEDLDQMTVAANMDMLPDQMVRNRVKGRLGPGDLSPHKSRPFSPSYWRMRLDTNRKSKSTPLANAIEGRQS